MAFRSRRLRVQLPCQAESSVVDVVAAREAGECPAGLVSASEAPCNWVFASSAPCHELTCLDPPGCRPDVSEPPPPRCPVGFDTRAPNCVDGTSVCPGAVSADPPPIQPTVGCFPSVCPDLFVTEGCRQPSCDFFSLPIVEPRFVRDDSGTILVDPRALPLLRERLAERLRQIEAAELEKDHLRARLAEIDGAAEELRRRGDAVE